MSLEPSLDKHLMNAAHWQETKRLFHRTLEMPSEKRDEFLHGEGSDLRVVEQVQSLLLAHEAAGDFISRPALVEAGVAANGPDSQLAAESTYLGRKIGSYEIIRELGRGGMGAVFLASRADAQFAKRVAIKIIKCGMDTESILRRFMIERQILANLEHENIARLLDGGTTEDGLPYFVMEYVEGVPITKYCDVKRLSIADRLRLFRRVCVAVQYAHQNLIVHRDLKPSNILVTANGTPKLLDFGIAKLLNADSSSDGTEDTAGALRLMTPEYASPEQLRGLLITTATDVYSLGIILYELLSGQRPFRFPSRAPEEIVRVVLTQEPTPPSEAVSGQLSVVHGHRSTRRHDATTDDEQTTNNDGQKANRQSAIGNPKFLRGDLDNIVLKSLRTDPERRYASVEELYEDIRRHLTGLPVTARRDTFGYRAGKFIQRHRVGLAVATLLGLTLVSATVVTSRQAYVARREHAKAELLMAEQRKLADSLIGEVQKSLKDVPHSLIAQRLLAQKSLEYLNNLAKDAGDDPAYLGELAAAYQNLGYLQAWTLQDNVNALLTYEKAIDLARKRLTIEPKGLAARRALGDILGNKIESLNLMQRAEESASTFVEKLGIEEQLLNDDPQNPERLMWVAESLEADGEVLRSIQQNDEANAKFQIAVDLASRAVDVFKAQANTPQQRTDLSLSQEKLGSMFEQLHELPQAAQAYREAVTTASAVHAEHPEIVQALRNTTSSHWYLGMLLDRQGDHQSALENYRASLRTILDATAADPGVDPARAGEMKYSIVVGRVLCKLGQREEGVKLLRHGIELTLNLIESEKGNRQNTYYGSETLTWAVEGLAAAGLRDEAKGISLKMIDWAQDSAQNSPNDAGPCLRLANLYGQLGDVYAGYDQEARKVGTSDQARLTEARRWYERGLGVLNDLGEDFKVPKSIVQARVTNLQEKISACDVEADR
jgi:serine/threonine protein kinase/tetratricopeptide (TPR) repeat protein